MTSNNMSFKNVSLQNMSILEKLQKIQPKYKDALRETLQENFRKGGFIRIFPSKNSNIYDKFFAPPAQLQSVPSQ